MTLIAEAVLARLAELPAPPAGPAANEDLRVPATLAAGVIRLRGIYRDWHGAAAEVRELLDCLRGPLGFSPWMRHQCDAHLEACGQPPLTAAELGAPPC